MAFVSWDQLDLPLIVAPHIKLKLLPYAVAVSASRSQNTSHLWGMEMVMIIFMVLSRQPYHSLIRRIRKAGIPCI